MATITPEQAEEIIERYSELISLIKPKVESNPPSYRGGNRDYHLHDLYWSVDDASFVALWDIYLGCGDSDQKSTHYNLSDLLK
jgi:hypothetical protein